MWPSLVIAFIILALCVWGLGMLNPLPSPYLDLTGSGLWRLINDTNGCWFVASKLILMLDISRLIIQTSTHYY